MRTAAVGGRRPDRSAAPGRISVVVIPERFRNGALTPCAYIRLMQPLDHLATAADFDIILADAEVGNALPRRHHRHAALCCARCWKPAEALLRHCREHGIALLYDLDDDLLHVPRDHPDAVAAAVGAQRVSRMVRGAGAVWVSTAALAATVAKLRDDVRVAEWPR